MHSLLLLILISLSILVSPAEAQNEEENDTPEGAERISATSKKKSELYSPEDVDFFRIEIRADRADPTHDTSGNLTVTLSQESPPGADSNTGWQVDLYAEDDLANSLYTATLPETRLELKFEQALAPGRYYYKVSSLNAEKIPAKEYSLQGAWKESRFYEKPPNDTPPTATPLEVNNNYAGNLSSDDDIDFYQFSLATADTVTVTFNQDTPAADSTVGWEMGLFAQSSVGSPLQEARIPATKKSVTLQTPLAAGAYYVRVAALTQEKTKKAPAGRRYQLQVIATSVVSGNLCPTAFTYAQNPLTTRWVAFPTRCDVPASWFSTQVRLTGIEACPSSYATYRPKDGSLRLPQVEASNDKNESLGVFAVKLQQIPAEAQLLFEVVPESLKQIK